MEITLTKEEKIVCKILHNSINERRGICDPTNFNADDEEILADFQRKGYLHTDVNCIILKKEFKEYLDTIFGGNQ